MCLRRLVILESVHSDISPMYSIRRASLYSILRSYVYGYPTVGCRLLPTRHRSSPNLIRLYKRIILPYYKSVW